MWSSPQAAEGWLHLFFLPKGSTFRSKVTSFTMNPSMPQLATSHEEAGDFGQMREVFPKIGDKIPPNPIEKIGFSMIIFTIHFGGVKYPYFWKHPYCSWCVLSFHPGCFFSPKKKTTHVDITQHWVGGIEIFWKRQLVSAHEVWKSNGCVATLVTLMFLSIVLSAGHPSVFYLDHETWCQILSCKWTLLMQYFGDDFPKSSLHQKSPWVTMVAWGRLAVFKKGRPCISVGHQGTLPYINRSWTRRMGEWKKKTESVIEGNGIDKDWHKTDFFLRDDGQVSSKQMGLIFWYCATFGFERLLMGWFCWG